MPDSRRRLHPVLVAALAVVVTSGTVALVAWPLGGWATATPASAAIPEIDPAEGTTGGLLDVAIDRVAVTAESPDGFSELEPGHAWLVVDTRLTSHDIGPVYPLTYGDALAVAGLPGVDDDPTPDQLRRPDDDTADTLNPLIETGTLFIWQVDEEWIAQHPSVRIGICDWTRRTGVLIEGDYWSDRRVVAEVELEVADLRSAP